MKFLKYFESNEESNLFWKINGEEYCKKVYNDKIGYVRSIEWIKKNHLEFTNKELSEISKYFPNTNKRSNQIVFNYCVFLTKMEDEWYYAYINNNNIYRCDQFDGFIACLKYLKNKGDI